MIKEAPEAAAKDYVVRVCRLCGHAPHGIGLVCWNDDPHCGCRG